MHRIDTSGNVDNRFHPGNPATGQQATLVDQDWLNAVQEEIVSVILAANIPLEKGTNDQLAAAIVALIAGVVGDGSGAVPTTRQVLAGGLLTGGGNLAADRTISLAGATVQEAADQIRDDVAVTPASLAGLVSLTEIGASWVIRLGEVIVQLFSGTVQGNSTTVLTLPQAFPTLCRSAFVNGDDAIGNAQDNAPFVNGVGASSISVFNARDNSVLVNVLAIGK